MISADVERRIAAFGENAGAAAFPNLGVTRRRFAQDLLRRVKSPGLINQGSSSLCGAASFCYSLAKRHPPRYADYVMSLYQEGQATVGALQVKPDQDCKLYRPSPSEINPVDWVALASLRDSQNAVFDYQSVTDAFPGITLPSALAGWFKRAGFKAVTNCSNLMIDKDLHTLLQADQHFASGAAVCLFIGARLLTARDKGKFPADHWIVMNGPLTLNGQSGRQLLKRGQEVNNDPTLLKGKVDLQVFTWGNELWSLKNVPVSDFLDYFYGFVSAK